VLAEFEGPLVLPVDGGDEFLAPVQIGHMYNGIVATPLAGQTDAIFFLPRVSPLRAD
jgi:hypothetical protein